MNPATLLDLLVRSEFLAGLGWGIVGVVAILVVRRRSRPLPIWGLVVATCTLGASYQFIGRRLSLIAGVAILALAGTVAERSWWVAAPGLALGAFLVAWRSGIPEENWVRLGVVALILVGGWCVARIDRLIPEEGLPALMLAGSAFGIWATVPETDLASVLLGTLTALLLTAWPSGRTRIGGGGAYALAATMAWVVAVGGQARPGSIVGGLATIGAFMAAPLVVSLPDWRRWAVFAVHGSAVLVAARVAGMFTSAETAAVVASAVLLVVVLAVWLISRSPVRTPPAASDYPARM